jgi:Carboxypeptidase regulatory-like domain
MKNPRTITFIILILIYVMAASAQEAQQATVSGFVTDQSQAAVAGTRVTLSNQATGLSRQVTTDSEGLYTVVGLQPGVYNAKVTASGFKTAEQVGITLNVGASIRLNFTLEPGQVTETVTVQAEVGLQSETGEVANLITGTQITEVALNGRNFTQFLTLGTGVSSSQTGRQMGLGQEGNPLMSVHGGRISMNKFTYDGTLAMDTGGNRGLDLFPPMEAIAEVKVQKSNYGADAGGFGYSVVNVVTRSGGKQFHGDIYEYFRNDRLDARNFFANERQVIRLNNFGYTFSGPFFIPGRYNRDRTKDFFFWSQSWLRRVGPQINSFTAPPQGVFTAQVPTEAMRRGDFRGVATPIRDPENSNFPFPSNIIPIERLDPNALILLDSFYPLANRGGALNFVHNTRSFTTFREELLRWDHHFNQNWTWTLRYAQDTWFQEQDIKRPSSTVLPTFPNRFGKPGKNLTTKLTTVITPRTINLFTFGYSFNRITNEPRGGQRPSGLSLPEVFDANQFNLVPNITLAQGFASIGTGDVLNNSNPIYTWKDDFSLNRGRHNFKFGAEIIHHRKKSIAYDNEQGSFNFNGSVTGHAVADFLLGRATSYTENDADQQIEVTAWANEFYAQDDFKVTNNLALNLGVRWFLIRGGNGGAEVEDRISAFVPGVYNPAAAPQLLLPNGRLVPGTGDPLNGIILPTNLKGLEIGRAMKKPVNDAIGPRLGLAYSLNNKTVIRSGYGINYFWGTNNNENKGTNPPFVNSVNIQNTRLSNPLGGTGARFPPNVNSLDVFPRQPSVQSWSLTIQRELMTNLILEVGYVGTRGTHLPRTIQLNQADPTRSGDANLRRPFLGYGTIAYNENSAVSKYHGLEVSVSRRVSRGLLFEASYTHAKSLGHVEGNPLDSRNKDLDFGLTDLDRTHMFTFNYVYEFPFLKGAGGALEKALGGWQLSGITTFQSGVPFNVTQSGDVANFGGGTGAQRPDIVGNPYEGRGDSLDRYFNTAAFRRVTQTGRIGTSPVNPVRGPGINNFDLSLFKYIYLREGVRFQFGVEAYNIFNHAQFEGVDGNIVSDNFGSVTSARDPRVLQLRAKFSF